MNSGVTVACFLLSYLIVLVLEISRWVVRFPGRMLVLIGMMTLGWIAHSLFLADRLWASISHQDNPLLLSSWFQWSLLAAWGIASIYLIFLVRRPENAIGAFVLPLVLSLIGLAHFFRNSPPFQRDASINFWRIFHGASLLVGTMIITFGLAVGLMYVVHAYRLKHKLKASMGFRLPSLEYLQSLNRWCVFVSASALGLGLVSGVVLNFNRSGQISWSDRGILVTAALFVWLLVATLIETTSARSLGGLRTAYLSIANFVFFVLVLSVVLFSAHGRTIGQSTKIPIREPLALASGVLALASGIPNSEPLALASGVEVNDSENPDPVCQQGLLTSHAQPPRRPRLAPTAHFLSLQPGDGSWTEDNHPCTG